MKTPISFTAELLKHENMNASYIIFPFDVMEVFGRKGQIRVKILIDGNIEHRGSLAKYRSTYHWMGISQELRAKIGKSFGEKISLQMWEDTEERIVEIPEDILQLFKEHKTAFNVFQKLSYTHKKEYIRWIENAKKTETREARKTKMLTMLLEGKKGI